MTENEAIEKLHAYLECESRRAEIVSCNESCDDCELCYMQGTGSEHIASVEKAIKALEEVQQYRVLEKRLSDMFGGSLSLKMCVDELERILTEPDSPHPMNAKILTYQEAADWEAYRAIGTPEECRKSVDICKAMAERRISLENMENYMKFEDECVKRGFTFNSLLEAREKQIAKRAMHQGCYDKNGEWHEWNGINGKPYELCPSCRVNL